MEEIIQVEPPAAPSANRQIARAAGIVMAAFILSNLFGLVRGILILKAFGAGAELDAFNTANRLSETLFNLVAGGALASAFVPTFTGFLARKETKEAWHLASAVSNLVLIILTVVSLVLAVFAPFVVSLLAPGFTGDPIRMEMTVKLLRLILPSVVIFGVSGLVMGILNANQVFLFPALAPSMYSIGLIFGVVVLAPSMGIYGLAWGTVIGAALHLLIQLPSLIKVFGHYQFTLGLKSDAVYEVIRLMLPRLVGAGIVQLNFLVNNNIASWQPAGSQTALTYAFTLMLMPQALIAQTIAIASLPTFSAQVALNKMNEMRNSLAATLRAVILLSLPASVGLVMLRQPLIALLYQRGEFTARSTDLMAWALLWYAAGLVGHCIVEVVSRAFYALHDTRTPVVIGVAAMSLNIIFSLLFSAWFTRIGWAPHGGLALANSLATALETVGLIYLMRRRLHGIEGATIWQVVIKSALAVVGMGLVLAGWLAAAAVQPLWLQVTGAGILGVGAYYLLLSLLRVPETALLSGMVRRKLGSLGR
ncbi:MAG: murein biosynthesis integral membrane protein MurJ [Anaerolineaceae bacterium]